MLLPSHNFCSFVPLFSGSWPRINTSFIDQRSGCMLHLKTLKQLLFPSSAVSSPRPQVEISFGENVVSQGL